MQTLATMPSTAAATAAMLAVLPQYAGFAAMPAEEGRSTASIRTDGERIVVNPAFLSRRTGEEAVYAVAFISTMLANDALRRRGDRDPRLWQVACNVAIHNQLEELGVTGRPVSSLHVPELRGRTADEVHDLMLARDPVVGEALLAGMAHHEPMEAIADEDAAPSC